MYHLERKSATQLQEDTKIWLEALARKSRLARDRFNQKNLNGHHNLSTLDSGEELLESVAPLRLNTTRAKPLPFARKSGSQNQGICDSARSNIKSDSQAELPEKMQLHIPHLQRLRRSESPSSYSVNSEGVSRCCSSERLVSAWSSDTLSLLAAVDPAENRLSSSLESPTTSAEEEALSIGAYARRNEASC
ncbi:hypothetical protein PCANC_11135 [Puccinia coronata f. sp. avenae]|uniref:Uncharacterized protein n=1 Tax=Puccinia coronata f. sp. avenae TaxID=200324 RepID=A0A2N5V8U8_9BASI|nr:hypothetical protein PCANC_11135 [Puccinia coronata f. sp. avenae]